MKPQDLFLSLRDFFAIFVPGAVAIYAFVALNPMSLPKTNLVPGAETLLVAAAAYGIGSIFYAIGAGLDHLYELLERRIISRGRRQRLESFEAVATKAKADAISSVAGADAGLEQSWSNKSFWIDRLRRTCPIGSAELDRLESTQKFFRTFAIVLLIVGGNATLRKEWAVAALCLSAMACCLGFYVQRRAEWTYRLHKWVFLTLIK